MATKKFMKDAMRDITRELMLTLCEELRSTLKKEKLNVRKLRNIKRRRPKSDLMKQPDTEEPIDYINRIPDENFEELLNIVSFKIQKQNTLMREALPARVKLKIVLHYLTTGDNFQTLSELYTVPKNSISQFLPEVCEAISEGLQEYIIQMPRNMKDWEKIQHKFESKWNFTCCGAIDGCHIALRGTKNTPQNCVSLMCLVTADYKLIHVDIQRHEHVQNSIEFSKTTFSKFLQELNIPDDGVFVANSSFPLTDKILIPYESAKLTQIQNVFNYRLNRANGIAENALGLLQWKFRIFDRPSSLKMDTIESVLKAICALHNWILDTTDYLSPNSVDSEHTTTGTIIPGEWRQGTTLKKINFTKREGHPTAIFKRHAFASRFVVKDILQ